MEKLQDQIAEIISKESPASIIYSGVKRKSQDIKKITITSLKNANKYSAEIKYEKHNNIINLSQNELIENTSNWCEEFKQILIKAQVQEYQILINKKGKAKIIKKAIALKSSPHNKVKNYIIPDGSPCEFLKELGVMDARYKVKSQQYKKFKQINRFLEMVDDMFKENDTTPLHIVDFGCGKSYLSFAIYYYFKQIKKRDIKLTGVDLKEDVIKHCNNLAEKLSYTDLKFVHGFIHDFSVDTKIDFVITLHACDTATDEAMYFSLKNNVPKMMFVPCCQHELNKQLQAKENTPMLEHGIVRDRMTALITDTSRAKILETQGYKVQVMEFIDMEHTAKNILLRCQKVNKTESEKIKALEEYNAFKNYWNITPYLDKKIQLFS